MRVEKMPLSNACTRALSHQKLCHCWSFSSIVTQAHRLMAETMHISRSHSMASNFVCECVYVFKIVLVDLCICKIHACEWIQKLKMNELAMSDFPKIGF